MIRTYLAHGLLALAMFGAHDAAFAQNPDNSARPRWNIEVHAGISSTRNQSNGSGGVPATGSLIQGEISASTFYLGDGTRLFNDNQLAIFGAQAPLIAPLDGALVGAMVRHEAGSSFGARLERAIRDRFAVQIDGDFVLDHIAFTPEAVTAIETTRASWTGALQRTLSASPLSSSTSSVATLTDHQRARQLFATGAFVVKLRASGRTIPFITGGGGVVFNGGARPEASLVGNYTLDKPAQLFGTDTVGITYSEASLMGVGLFGGGFSYDVTSKWGIRVDAREYVFKNRGETDVAITPALAFQSTGQPFPLVDVGSLKFAPSAPLSSAPASATPTFSGTGREGRLVVSAGFFLRF